MKTTIFTFFLSFCASFGFAQIDRSIQPTPGPAPTINIEKPYTFTLDNGLKVLVVENHKLPKVSMNLTIDNSPIVEGEKSGVSSLTGSMLGTGTTEISKDAFNEKVDYLGANVWYGSQSAGANSLSKYFPEILELLADGAINPVFVQEEFDKVKKQLTESIKAGENDVSTIEGRVANALAYGLDHPYGEFISEESINKIQLNDVIKFYETYFKPENAYLVIVGDVDRKATKKLVKDYFSEWKAGKAPQYTYSAPKDVQYSQINFVDVPNAVQSEIEIINMVDLKMSDPDYHAALIANHILGGSFSSYLNMNLREEHGFTYGAGSSLRTNTHNASRFTASTSVRNAVTDSAVVEFFKEIKRIRDEKVNPETLKNAKAKYLGNFVLALENPRTVAQYALNIETKGLSQDFYKTYLEKINAVTAEDVMRVANIYFKADNARVVIAGKGSEVASKLEATGIPMLYFDKYANPVEKPNYQQKIPEGVTVQSVLDGYLNAIGGKDKITGLKSIQTTYETSINGASLQIIEKRTTDNYAQIVNMNGNPMMSVIINDKGTTIKQGATTVPVSPAMVKDLKNSTGVFPELNLLNDANVKLSGITKVDGKDAYQIDVPGEVIQTSYFYDIESGLKLKEQSVTSMGGQSQTNEALLFDYKDYDGVKLPSLKKATIGGMPVENKLSEAVINIEFTAEDFK